MTKRIANYFFKISFPCLLILFFSCKVSALEGIDESREKAFYAISSLCFHLDEVAANLDNAGSSNDEMIVFNDQDVENLWTLASANPSVLSQLSQAKWYYYQAQESVDDPILAGELYTKARDSLKTLWERLNFQILEEHAVLTERKTDMVNHNHRSVVYPDLGKNPYIDEELKGMVEGFLLPLDSPLKIKLDEIFSQSRAIRNIDEFKKAGFVVLLDKLHSYLVLSKHPLIPGYLEKVYLDTEQRRRYGIPGWLSLTNRCQGAANIRNLIKTKDLRTLTVPDKWLYLLPVTELANAKEEKNKHPVILIETDMKVVSLDESADAWKNKVTTRNLDELYCVLSHGFASSSLTKNVPYTKKGKFAFIDTEKPNKMPRYDKARPFLSDSMQQYWDELVRSGGNPKK